MTNCNNDFEKFENYGVVNFHQCNHNSNKNNGEVSHRPKSLTSHLAKELKVILCNIIKTSIYLIFSLLFCKLLFILLLPEQIPFFFLTVKMVKVFITK